MLSLEILAESSDGMNCSEKTDDKFIPCRIVKGSILLHASS